MRRNGRRPGSAAWTKDAQAGRSYPLRSRCRWRAPSPMPQDRPFGTIAPDDSSRCTPVFASASAAVRFVATSWRRLDLRVCCHRGTQTRSQRGPVVRLFMHARDVGMPQRPCFCALTLYGFVLDQHRTATSEVRLCRCITGPALSDERVQLNAAGQLELKLKTPWRDGTTHLVMSPLEFMQRLPSARSRAFGRGRTASAGRGCSSGLSTSTCSTARTAVPGS